MRILKITFAFGLLLTLLSFKANGQITNFLVTNDSLIGCQNNLVFYTQTASTQDTISVTINWGDGSQETLPYIVAPNSWLSQVVPHPYANPGTYPVTIDVYSEVMNAPLGPPYQIDMIVLPANACAYFYAYVYQPSPLVYFNADLDCTGADGQVTTIQLNQMYTAYGLDPNNAPYVVSVNDQWLSANGYIQVSPDQNITSFDATGMANNAQMTFEIDCAVAAVDPDFAINWMWPQNFVAPLQTGNLLASVCNYACSDTSDVTVSVSFPSNFVPVTTNLINASVNGNVLTFDLLQVTDCEYLTIPFTFPGNTSAGTSICFDMEVYHPNDSDNSNDSLSNCGTVLNSYDPNAKLVNHPLHIDVNTDETLQYEIHFQNDGNYYAVNVELVDTLSTNLDLSTFRFIGSKHPVTYSLDPVTRILKFSFYQIYLQPSSVDLEASQGLAIYEISEMPGLALQSEIENTAYIYFDYNPAIITNTTLNINSILAVNELEADAIGLYPNPSSGNLYITGSYLEKVEIFDLTGKQVFADELTGNKAINVSHLVDGLYTCIVTSSEGISTKKLLIRK